MSYDFYNTILGIDVYKRVDDDGVLRVTCAAHDPSFQDWLRANKDSLPSGIQSKVDAGTLTLEEAD